VQAILDLDLVTDDPIKSMSLSYADELDQALKHLDDQKELVIQKLKDLA